MPQKHPKKYYRKEMFPSPHHVKVVFSAFDIHDRGTLTPSELVHALHAVGLGDAPKQIVYGIIRQARNENQQQRASLDAVADMGDDDRASSPILSATTRYSLTLPASPTTPGESSNSSSRNAANGVGPSASDIQLTSSTTAPIETVTFEEFLAVVRELSPSPGSNEEVWKGFKCLDIHQRGRITLETMISVSRRGDEKLVGKLLLNPQQRVQSLMTSPNRLLTSPQRKGSTSPPPPASLNEKSLLFSPITVAGRRLCAKKEETSLRRLVESVAEYREKGVAFDEWRQALTQ